MSYTAQDVHEMAIVVLDELSASGNVDPNKTKEYANRAPRLLDMWKWEMARIEGLTDLGKITSLSQTLPISDRNCPSGAYYLAMHYAMADMNDELAAICKNKYQELKHEATLPATAVAITDAYSLFGGDDIESA